MVATLRRQTNAAKLLVPPSDANEWPAELVKKWFEDGGHLTVAALSEADCGVASLIDRVGVDYPVKELMPLCLGQEGLLGT